MRAWPEPEGDAAPDRVLVRFRSTPHAAARAAAQAGAPVLPGLQLARFAGKHHRQAVPRRGDVSVAMVAGSSAGSTGSVPADATMVFTITDGSSVQEKLKLLREHPGSCRWGEACAPCRGAPLASACPAVAVCRCCRSASAQARCLHQAGAAACRRSDSSTHEMALHAPSRCRGGGGRLPEAALPRAKRPALLSRRSRPR